MLSTKCAQKYAWLKYLVLFLSWCTSLTHLHCIFFHHHNPIGPPPPPSSSLWSWACHRVGWWVLGCAPGSVMFEPVPCPHPNPHHTHHHHHSCTQTQRMGTVCHTSNLRTHLKTQSQTTVPCPVDKGRCPPIPSTGCCTQFKHRMVSVSASDQRTIVSFLLHCHFYHNMQEEEYWYSTLVVVFHTTKNCLPDKQPQVWKTIERLFFPNYRL